MANNDGLIGVYNSANTGRQLVPGVLKTVYTVLKPYLTEIEEYVNQKGCCLLYVWNTVQNSEANDLNKNNQCNNLKIKNWELITEKKKDLNLHSDDFCHIYIKYRVFIWI